MANLVKINFMSSSAFKEITATNEQELYFVENVVMGPPSDEYVDLTLKSSGSEYTAPANGYIYIAKASGAARQYVSVGIKDTSGQSVIEDYNLLSSTTQNLTLMFPISKGATYVVGYNATGATNFFRFIYAQGEI